MKYGLLNGRILESPMHHNGLIWVFYQHSIYIALFIAYEVSPNNCQTFHHNAQCEQRSLHSIAVFLHLMYLVWLLMIPGAVEHAWMPVLHFLDFSNRVWSRKYAAFMTLNYNVPRTVQAKCRNQSIYSLRIEQVFQHLGLAGKIFKDDIIVS